MAPFRMEINAQMKIHILVEHTQLMMAQGKHPPSPGLHLSCLILVRENWQEAGGRGCCSLV